MTRRVLAHMTHEMHADCMALVNSYNRSLTYRRFWVLSLSSRYYHSDRVRALPTCKGVRSYICGAKWREEKWNRNGGKKSGSKWREEKSISRRMLCRMPHSKNKGNSSTMTTMTIAAVFRRSITLHDAVIARAGDHSTNTYLSCRTLSPANNSSAPSISYAGIRPLSAAVLLPAKAKAATSFMNLQHSVRHHSASITAAASSSNAIRAAAVAAHDGGGGDGDGGDGDLGTGGKIFFSSLCLITFGLGVWQTQRYFEKVDMVHKRQEDLALDPIPNYYDWVDATKKKTDDDSDSNTAPSTTTGEGLHPPNAPASGTRGRPIRSTVTWERPAKKEAAQSIINSALCF